MQHRYGLIKLIAIETGVYSLSTRVLFLDGGALHAVSPAWFLDLLFLLFIFPPRGRNFPSPLEGQTKKKLPVNYTVKAKRFTEKSWSSLQQRTTSKPQQPCRRPSALMTENPRAGPQLNSSHLKSKRLKFKMPPLHSLRNSRLHLTFLGFCFLVASIFLLQASKVITSTQSNEPSKSASDMSRGVLSATDSRARAVFYNIYVPSADKKYRAMSIIKEQLDERRHSPFLNSADLFYNVIGYNATDEIQQECGNNCHPIQYTEQGDESLTLQAMYEYCLDHPDTLVTYIHDKGSLHPTPNNRHFRSLLTKGAFSDQCQTIDSNDEHTCNVCGARFSPFPHMHVAGNMFSAKCSYIQKLIPPNQFRDKMEGLMEAVMQHAKDPSIPKPTFQQYQDEYFVGRNRFAMEHWIGSHPQVTPCDVYPGEYLCGYIDLPKSTDMWTPSLEVAPRFPVSLFEKRAAKGSWFCGQARLLEFQYLYGERPPEDSFIWNFYSEAFKTCPTPLDRSEHELLYSDLESVIVQ